MAAYAARYATRNEFMSRRAIGFIATALLHILIVYGLITGLARSVVEVLKGPIETKIIEEVQDKKDEPPPPPPKFDKPPPPFVPPPEIAITTTEAAPAAISNVTTQRPAAPVEAPAIPPKSNPRRPVSQPEYPPSSRRNGEEGVVVLLLYVLEDGKVGEAKVQTSSGWPKLDEAALNEALRSWRLLPGSKGGKPVAMWYPFKITFKIEK